MAHIKYKRCNTTAMKTYKIGNFNILEYEEMASTNTCAAEMPSNQLTDRMVILTWRQTQGRGQVGNSWESAPDSNISMTVVLKPERLEASRQFAVSMVIALGCFDFVSRYTDNVSVKWPNDIYVGNKKIAGILIEHKITGMYIGNSICGVGLNVNQEHFLFGCSQSGFIISTHQPSPSPATGARRITLLHRRTLCCYPRLRDSGKRIPPPPLSWHRHPPMGRCPWTFPGFHRRHGRIWSITSPG